MFTVEVEKIMSVMKILRRICFIVSAFVLSFIAYIGYRGIEIDLTEPRMTIMVFTPLLILITSGRWWEGLAGKEVIGFSFTKETVFEKRKKSGHAVVKKADYSPEIIHNLN